MKKIPMDKIWAVLKSKRFWKRFCLGLGLLWLAGQLIAGPNVAAEVREALLITDVLYVENGKQHALMPYDLEGIREIRLCGPEEHNRNIEIHFNDGAHWINQGERLEVKTKHIFTIYGIGVKRVWMKYGLESYNENGDLVRGAWDIPARLDYRWKWYRWELYEADSYYDIHEPFGIGTNQMLKKSVMTIFGPG